MRKHIFTTVLSSAIICLGLTLSSYNSQAATARTSLIKLSSEGFKSCKALGRSGWTGLVRGTTLDGSSTGLRDFSLRYCFKSQSQCQQFVNNAQNIVSNLDELRLRKCSPRS